LNLLNVERHQIRTTQKMTLNIEQSTGFTLAQGEDEMFIAAKRGASADRKVQR
jgi:hypothetical protein